MPAAQGEQATWRILELKLPGAQGAGMVEPMAHDAPRGQSEHALAASRPVALDHVPAGQGMGSAEPAGQAAPVGQASGATVAGVGQYEPAGQAPMQRADVWKAASEEPSTPETQGDG